MNILVCIKQVPDMESKFTIDGKWYSTNDLAWRMNEYDEYSVEQAVQLKEQLGEGDITVLCIGPARVKEAMKKALAMGCDKGAFIDDENSHLKDSYEIASLIHSFASQKDFDIIFCGMQSQDRSSGQVGIILGEKLGIPSISTIVDFSFVENTATVKRELEGGVKAVVSVPLPALFTCQLGLNSPRYPTLPNIMKAKKKELITIPLSELPDSQSLQKTVDLFFPEKKGGGLLLEGDPVEIADKLIQVIKEKTSVLS